MISNMQAVLEALDPLQNSQIRARVPVEIHAASDRTIVAVDADGVARLSDPASVASAAALASCVVRPLVAARGPVDAVDSFVAHLAEPSWVRVFEGIEMAWTAEATVHAGGAMRCAIELDEPARFQRWRDEFIVEAFVAGGSPPPVRLDELFVWLDPEPCAMAGLLQLGRDAARIVTVYTAPALRGRGYAGSLVAALAARARVPIVTLDVSILDPYARRAYERAGFRAVGHTATWMHRQSSGSVGGRLLPLSDATDR